jgi:hypothetical protein
VAAGVELACSQFVTVHRLLWETLAMVGQDILQLAWVSIKWEGKKAYLPDFFWFFLF